MMNINCSTCLESFTPGCDISTTPCGHVFHTGCITRWLNQNNNCSQCREACENRQIIKLYFSESQSAIEENITINDLEQKSLKLEVKSQKCERDLAAMKTVVLDKSVEMNRVDQKCKKLEREKLLMKLDWSKTEWNLKESLKEANKQISDTEKEQRLTRINLGLKERQVELQVQGPPSFCLKTFWQDVYMSNRMQATGSGGQDPPHKVIMITGSIAGRTAFESRAGGNGGSCTKQPLPPLFISTTLQELGNGVQKLVGHGLQVELLHQAKVLFDHQDYVDLTFYCEDGVVQAHQMLLAVASPFLKFLFQTHKWQSPLCEPEDIGIILPETKVYLVQALIHFVYTGYVVSDEDNFYSLMKLIYSLNINASIEAESTLERPTIFSPVGLYDI